MQTHSRIALICVAVIASSLQTLASASPAMEESDRLAGYIQAEYGPFSRDLAHLRLGHQACAYSFVDEQALNDLVDAQLNKMIQRGAELIVEAQSAVAKDLSSEAQDYAARLAVHTAMALYSSAIRAELAPGYGSGEADCVLSADQNLPRYRAMQRYAMP